LLANPVWVVLVGALAGLLPGLFGFGGGWLLVPILVLLIGDAGWAYAPGTALCAILAGASSGVAGLWLGGRHEAHAAAPPPARQAVTVVMVTVGLLGTAMGKLVLQRRLVGLASATMVLDGVLIVVLLVIGGRLLYEAVVGYERAAPRQADAVHLVGLGLATLVPGALSGLLGIGGGILYFPLLLFFLHWGADDARATSRLTVLGSALLGAGLYAWSGGVHFATAAGMFIPAGVVGVATSRVRFSHSPGRVRAFKLLSSVMALAALVLTALHMARGGGLARPQGSGGLPAAALAVAVPLVWGVACALGQRLVTKRNLQIGE